MEGRESTVSGSPANTEADSPVSGVVPQVMNMAVNMSLERSLGGGGGGGEGEGEGEGGGIGMGMMSNKKRGRPRKYDSDGNLALALSPGFSLSPSDYFPKRGRGRPPGSGRRQILASFGELIAKTAGGNFTPHVVTIKTGEDVAAKIHSFSHRGPLSVCILSANGAVSNVTIRQPGSSGGILTYEGRFEILSLTGSYTLTDTGGVRSRTGGISVSLAGPDGRVIGGGVAGLLMAASPIQVVVGSFMPNSLRSHKKRHHVEPSMGSTIPGVPGIVTAARPISQATPDDDTCATPTSTLPGQSHREAENSVSSNPNPDSTSFRGAGWQSSQSTSDQKPSPDINIGVSGE